MHGFLLILLSLGGAAYSAEHVGHGPHSPHTKSDGKHNVAYDHEAVLGSGVLEEEFANLPPEEATRRLLELAKKYDEDGDKFLTEAEMYKWMVASFMSLDREEALEHMVEEDTDKDEFVSWEEYLKQMFAFSMDELKQMEESIDGAEEMTEEMKDNSGTLKMVREDRRKFQGADVDQDGKLNKNEYVTFFFPQNFPHMHKYELETYLEDKDKNKDGVISLDEFVPGEGSVEADKAAKTNFEELDKDGDKLLTSEELKNYVVPDVDEIAEEEAEHLIQIADADKDGKLSFDEIAARTKEFVGNSLTDYGRTLREDL